MKNKKVLIIAGGTGGHIFPALAVADKLQDDAVTVEWLGTYYGMEKELVPKRFPLHFVAMRGVRKKGLLTKLLMPIYLIRALVSAFKLIKKIKPDVVLAMGGYAALPGGIATYLCRLPLIIHEQNARAGMSNRILSKIANQTLQAFPDAFSTRNKAVKKIQRVVGNPVRDDLWRLDLPENRLQRNQGKLNILILGGSQGAKAINDTVIDALKNFPEKDALKLWHQTGKQDYENVVTAYHDLNIDARIAAFIEDVSAAYAWADLVVCRSGALTVSELAAVGVASILIPYPHAVDDHQFFNARYLEVVGAADIILQRNFSAERLQTEWRRFLQDRSRLITMAMEAKKIAKPDSVNLLLMEIKQYFHR